MVDLTAELESEATGKSVKPELARRIVALSVAEEFELAVPEWQLLDVWLSEEPGQCLCDQPNIIEHCLIGNRLNGARTIVGNHCVTNFLKLDSSKLFQGLHSLKGNPHCHMRAELAEFVFDRQWILAGEFDFLTEIRDKRKLTDEQFTRRGKINRRVSFYLQERGSGYEMSTIVTAKQMAQAERKAALLAKRAENSYGSMITSQRGSDAMADILRMDSDGS